MRSRVSEVGMQATVGQVDRSVNWDCLTCPAQCMGCQPAPLGGVEKVLPNLFAPAFPTRVCGPATITTREVPSGVAGQWQSHLETRTSAQVGCRQRAALQIQHSQQGPLAAVEAADKLEKGKSA
jgi:hypothetical protein